MSANIDTMMYVGETPWHNLGAHYETAPTSSEEIISGAHLDWTVNSAKMKTDLHGDVPNYHAIYREDTDDILGVVDAASPKLVQNSATFNAFDKMLGKDLDVETAASLGKGEKVFGCFKIHERFKVLDDDIDHYFVVFNDHLKVDGKVTILNTPVRVVCQNTLSHALNNNFYKLRIPVSTDSGVNATNASRLLQSVQNAIEYLKASAESMVKAKISREYVDKLLDELFPYIETSGPSMHDAANESVNSLRNAFLGCMGVDNLNNYRGTQYQVFNALTDFTQHHFKKLEKAYDINHRMKLLPGMGADSESSKVSKFLKIKDKLIA